MKKIALLFLCWHFCYGAEHRLAGPLELACREATFTIRLRVDGIYDAPISHAGYDCSCMVFSNPPLWELEDSDNILFSLACGDYTSDPYTECYVNAPIYIAANFSQCRGKPYSICHKEPAKPAYCDFYDGSKQLLYSEYYCPNDITVGSYEQWKECACEGDQTWNEETKSCECEEGEYYDEEAEKCKQKTTKIYFVNGILNTQKEAENSKKALEVAKSGFLEDNYKHELFEFDLGYNYSYSGVKDILEVIYQKQQELNYRLDLSSYDMFLMLFAIGSLLSDDFGAIIENSVALEFDKISLQSIWEYYADVVVRQHNTLSELKGKVETDLKEGRRVLLVAHSQGNLFANQLMQAFDNDPKYKNSVAMIGVASPAGQAFSNTIYQSADDDRIINILRVKFPNAILPANVDNDPGALGDFRDITNHMFIPSYFDIRLPSKENINIGFNAFVDTLTFPNEKQSK